MAVSAFKSTSRRGPTRPSPTSSSSKISSLSDRESKSAGNVKTAPPPAIRRSRSVSAVARNPRVDTSSSSVHSSTSASDFLITRENPLYWSDKEKTKDGVEQDFPILASKSFKDPTPKPNAPPDSDHRRGRSFSRAANAIKTSAPANAKLSLRERSPSRVDIGRRRARSVSRAPISRSHASLNSESDVEMRRSLPTMRRNGNDASGVVIVGRSNGSERRSSIWQIQSDGSATTVPSSPSYSWEDAALGGSCSDAEERTIKAVCEQMKLFQVDNLEAGASDRIYETVRSEVRRAISDIQGDLATAIRRSAVGAAGVADVTDIPPDLVDPSAVELVLDIRREYATKLEQSHERAMKLRANLAVEEHRGLELSRILKEVLPDPKASNGRKPRAGRKRCIYAFQEAKTKMQWSVLCEKSSIERRKMSKRLTEEAMTYFDECVSLSTFDSSDLSSQDDPPMRFVGTHVADRTPFTPATPTMTADGELKSGFNNNKEAASMWRASGLSATSSKEELAAAAEVSISSSQTQSARSFQFSFSRKLNDTLDIQHDIEKYTKSFGKDIERADSQTSASILYEYDVEEYNLQSSQQSMLFDRVFFRSRIVSGSMLLCGGGPGVSL